MKTVTIREVFEAIKKNGFIHEHGEWFSSTFDTVTGSDKVIGGCVLGQAALNLNVIPINFEIDDSEIYTPNTLYGELKKFPATRGKWFDGFEDEINDLASQIIYWNDKEDDKEEEDEEYNFADTFVLKFADTFVLKTYEDVVQMAYDCLSPHFDEEIQLIEKEWDYIRT